MRPHVVGAREEAIKCDENASVDVVLQQRGQGAAGTFASTLNPCCSCPVHNLPPRIALQYGMYEDPFRSPAGLFFTTQNYMVLTPDHGAGT